MESRELAARLDGNSAIRRNDEDSAEMPEDSLTDLPIHFQPIQAHGNGHGGSRRTTIPHSVNKSGLMDGSTQYLDTSILTSNYTSPPQNYTSPPPPQNYTSPPPPQSYTSPPPQNYTTPPPLNYTNVALANYTRSSTSSYTSPPPSNYTSPAPPNTMDTGCSYSPANTPSLFQSQNLGNHGDAMGSTATYGSSYHDSSHCAGINNGGMYGSSSLNSQFAATENTAIAGPSGENGHHRVGDAYRSSDVHPSNDTAGNNDTLGLYSESRLCSAGVNTVESAFELNRQFSTVQSGGHKGQEGGEQQSGSTGEQSTKPFQCPDCGASFTRVDHLSRHLKTQSSHFKTENDKQYHPCPQCSKLFTRRDHMKRHTKIHGRGEPVKCVECQTWFPSKMELTHHLLDAHHVLVFECNVCSKGFFEAKYLTRHLRDKHDMIDGPDGRLVQAPNSKLPPSSHALQLPYRCGICSLSFVHELACNKHMVSHTRDTKRTGSPVDTLSLASSHLAEVRDAAAMAQLSAQLLQQAGWPQDDVLYNGTSQALSPSGKGTPFFNNGMAMPLLPHLPGQSVKPEPCDGDREAGALHGKQKGVRDNSSDTNGLLAFSQAELVRRIKQITGNDNFLCGVCGNGFQRAQELKSHLRRHSGHHRFACMDCGASFASSSNLVRHQRTHSGEKPFKCSLCTSAFTHKGALINHERIHTGERPYVCELCEAAFARVDALTRHKRTHKEYRIKQEEDGSTDGMFGLHA